LIPVHQDSLTKEHSDGLDLCFVAEPVSNCPLRSGPVSVNWKN